MRIYVMDTVIECAKMDLTDGVPYPDNSIMIRETMEKPKEMTRKWRKNNNNVFLANAADSIN